VVRALICLAVARQPKEVRWISWADKPNLKVHLHLDVTGSSLTWA